MKQKLARTVPILLALLCFAAEASAWLCEPKHVTARHNDEASLIAAETFAQGDYASPADYAARVLGCNRRRDDLAKKIEDAIPADHSFAQDLPPRLIKGHIAYFGFAPMRYGYKLQRKAGTWILTTIAEFHFPAKFPNRIDLPMELAEKLGIDDTICASTTMSGLGHVDRGYLENKDGFPSCRVGRDELFDGEAATVHLMSFWREVIQTYWSRDGFEVRVRIVNLGNLDDSVVKEYQRHNVVWHVRMNHKKNTRAMYKAAVGRPHPLYAGLDGPTIAHEYGHSIGLDDEYAETKNPPANRICADIGGDEHVMCRQPQIDWSLWRAIDWTTFPAAGLPYDDYAKGLYAWITTRRYSVGEVFAPQCLEDDDCEADEWCDRGTATLGRNQCKKKRGLGGACQRPGQCVSHICPAVDLQCGECNDDSDCRSAEWCKQGVPGSANTCEPKRANGAGCSRSLQCVSSLCPAPDFKCSECSNDSHCDGDEFCNEGTLGVGSNSCDPKKGNGASCSRGKECVSGLCPAPDFKCSECTNDSHCDGDEFCNEGTLGVGANSCDPRKNNGASCSRANECRSGLCPAPDFKCSECTNDSHCDGDEFCNEGTLGVGANSCDSRKSNGASCSRPNECESGLCPAPDFKCSECTNDSHCDGDEFCNEGTLGVGANSCDSRKSNGASCSRPNECRSGLCPAPDFKCSECTNDSHCDNDEYCDTGTLGIGQNQCKNQKNQGESCSRKDQCKSSCCKIFNFKMQCRPSNKC